MLVKQTPLPRKVRSELTIGHVKAMLEEWFGSPVVLTSSGRGAINLVLGAFELNRYKHLLSLPRLITACVLEPVVRHAFPVDTATGQDADLTLLYHQYGFPQICKPAGAVVEDICQAFFATVSTGRRPWAGQMAVFSLTKFFSTNSMVGGVVVHDKTQAENLRRRRDAIPERTAQQEVEESDIYCDPEFKGQIIIDQMRRSRLLNPRISDNELGGLPRNIGEIELCGQRRREIINIYCNAVGEYGCPTGWQDMMRTCLPYFFPIAGDEERLASTRLCLNEIGVEADIYSVDVNRDMRSPRYCRMLLVPCHDAIPDAIFSDMLSVLKRLGRRIKMI